MKRYARFWWIATHEINGHRFSAVASEKHVAWQDLIELVALEVKHNETVNQHESQRNNCIRYGNDRIARLENAI